MYWFKLIQEFFIVVRVPEDLTKDYQSLVENPYVDPEIRPITFENLRKKNMAIRLMLSKISNNSADLKKFNNLFQENLEIPDNEVTATQHMEVSTLDRATIEVSPIELTHFESIETPPVEVRPIQQFCRGTGFYFKKYYHCL